MVEEDGVAGPDLIGLRPTESRSASREARSSSIFPRSLGVVLEMKLSSGRGRTESSGRFTEGINSAASGFRRFVEYKAS